jgi:hypothetical protein
MMLLPPDSNGINNWNSEISKEAEAMNGCTGGTEK